MNKECKCCGKIKDTIQFSKCSRKADGLQSKCKACNSLDNQKFRTIINPTHHQKYQVENYDTHLERMKTYRRAAYTPKLYYIKNPDGAMYIGMTEMKLTVRALEHRHHYKRALQGKRKRLPLLHQSFDKYGLDSHQFGLLSEHPGLNRKELHKLEKACINSIKVAGVSLNTTNR